MRLVAEFFNQTKNLAFPMVTGIVLFENRLTNVSYFCLMIQRKNSLSCDRCGRQEMDNADKKLENSLESIYD